MQIVDCNAPQHHIVNSLAYRKPQPNKISVFCTPLMSRSASCPPVSRNGGSAVKRLRLQLNISSSAYKTDIDNPKAKNQLSQIKKILIINKINHCHTTAVNHYRKEQTYKYTLHKHRETRKRRKRT